ncbi:hypothetical protein ACFV84_19195 [Kitasatospora sp. NPDC059811]|uniref:hypothetical protein n=1 Tax=Streptomycetaceae TaxID=2062 RepID=UPI000B070FB1|nr:hypothetical protein [Streptomyces sp. MJM8645]
MRTPASALRRGSRWTVSAATAAALLLGGAGVSGASGAAPSGVPDGPDGPVSGVPGAVRLAEFTWEKVTEAVSADGRTVYLVLTDVVGGRQGVYLSTVDTQTGTVRARLPLGDPAPYGRPALSPDGHRLYVGVGSAVYVIDTATNTVKARIAAPAQQLPAGWTPGAATSLATDPDGETLYVGQSGPSGPTGQEEPGRILEFSTGDQEFIDQTAVTAHTVNDLAVLPDGSSLYAGTNLDLLRLDIRTGLGTAKVVDPGAKDELALSPDGSFLLALGSVRTYSVGIGLDTGTDKVRYLMKYGSGYFEYHHPAMNTDGSRVYLLGGPSYTIPVPLYTLVPGENRFDQSVRLSVPETYIHALATGPDGHSLYVTGCVYSDSAKGCFLRTLQI